MNLLVLHHECHTLLITYSVAYSIEVCGNNQIQLFALDFYGVIVDEGKPESAITRMLIN